MDRPPHAGLPRDRVPIESLAVSAHRVPTDAPESDGTAEWSETTIVLVEVRAGGRTGLGWTYADVPTARLCAGRLAEGIRGSDAFAVGECHQAMWRAVRNLGRPGVCSMAISAIDVALWDLRARLVELPLYRLLGATRDRVPAYGSGGFTSYSDEQLAAQLGGWAARGFRAVKMKIGRHPERDLARVRLAREAIGPEVALYVDANGAYDRKQALAFAERFAALGVTWFEEPVSSDDLEGLRLLRDRARPPIEIAAGEYGYEPFYFRRLLEAQAVDVLQADATRCGGITGFLGAAALTVAHGLPLSSHTAPAIHAHAMCAVARMRPLEYFHDHARLEALLFEGALEPIAGELRPDPSRPGLGVEIKRAALAQLG